MENNVNIAQDMLFFSPFCFLFVSEEPQIVSKRTHKECMCCIFYCNSMKWIKLALTTSYNVANWHNQLTSEVKFIVTTGSKPFFILRMLNLTPVETAQNMAGCFHSPIV